MSVNWRQSEIYIVINDKLRGSITKHLSWNDLLHYKFIIHLLKYFLIDQHLAMLQANG